MTVLKKAKFLLIALAVMAAVLLFNGSFLSLTHNILELKKLNAHSAALDEEYKKLAEEYQRIQDGDTSYLQRTARVKYNMVKPGEIEFRTVK